MSKSDKELADELDAADRLKKRGFRRVSCDKCHGLGERLEHDRTFRCFTCDGKGYKWESPLMC